MYLCYFYLSFELNVSEYSLESLKPMFDNIGNYLKLAVSDISCFNCA